MDSCFWQVSLICQHFVICRHRRYHPGVCCRRWGDMQMKTWINCHQYRQCGERTRMCRSSIGLKWEGGREGAWGGEKPFPLRFLQVISIFISSLSSFFPFFPFLFLKNGRFDVVGVQSVACKSNQPGNCFFLKKGRRKYFRNYRNVSGKQP